MSKQNKTLFVVAVPIGNLEDFTHRATRLLLETEVVFCESVENAKKLLTLIKNENKKTFIPYHKFNERDASSKLESVFEKYSSVVLISDSGTPGISDPGAYLVNAARELGIDVVPVVGASALSAAISVSGNLEKDFVFLGFLDRAKLKKEFEKILSSPHGTQVFYESPLRIVATLKELAKQSSDVRLTVLNDITKMHERTYYGSIKDVIVELENNPNHKKGEYVVVVHLPSVGVAPKSDPKENIIDFVLEQKYSKNEIKKIIIELKKRL